MRKVLTQATVTRQSPPATGRIEIHDTLMPGLVLRVTAAGQRSYAVRARQRNQLRNPVRITLGPAHLYTLSEAREKAREVLRQLHEGQDPREQKRTQAALLEASQRTRFAAVAERYIEEHLSPLRSYHQSEPLIRKRMIAEWGRRQIADITTDDVAGLVQRLRTKNATAIRVLALCKHLFAWAASPARPKDERLIINPAANLHAKDFGLKPGRRQVALSNDHMQAIWLCGEQLGGPWRPFLHLLMLSGQRLNEIAGLRWAEVNFDERVILIPASRMKMKRDHEIPLSPAMFDILANLREGQGNGPLVLGRPLTGGSVTRMKHKLDALIEQHTPGVPAWVIHDIRRAVRTGLGAIPSIPHDVRELVIGHVPPALVRTYDTHGYRDEKREALTRWSERLARIVEPPPESNVVRIA